MKINELVNLRNPPKSDRIIKFILTNCKPYLDQTWGVNKNIRPLYRGIPKRTESMPFFSKPRQDRIPMSTSWTTTTYINTAFTNAGFVANRTNSFFTTGKQSMAASYGAVHAVYPVGHFDFTWSPILRDMFISLSKMIKSDVYNFDLEKFLNTEYNNMSGVIQRSLFYYIKQLFGFIEYAVDNSDTSKATDVNEILKVIQKEIPKVNPDLTLKIIEQFIDPEHYGLSYPKMEEISVDITNHHNTLMEILKVLFIGNSEEDLINTFKLTKMYKSIIEDATSNEDERLLRFTSVNMEALTHRVKEFYREDNLVDAIESGHEIMITGKKFLFISEYDHNKIIGKLFKSYTGGSDENNGDY